MLIPKCLGEVVDRVVPSTATAKARLSPLTSLKNLIVLIKNFRLSSRRLPVIRSVQVKLDEALGSPLSPRGMVDDNLWQLRAKIDSDGRKPNSVHASEVGTTSKTLSRGVFYGSLRAPGVFVPLNLIFLLLQKLDEYTTRDM